MNKYQRYRELARCLNLNKKQLEEKLKVLETKEIKTAEYQKLLEEKDREIASYLSHIQAIPVQEKEITIETGVQCTLLEEQINRAHRGEKGLLPKFIPDIHQMKSRHDNEVKWLKDSLLAEKKKNAAKIHADGPLGATSKYVSSRYSAVGQSAPKYPTHYNRNFKPSNVDNTGTPSITPVSNNPLGIEHQHSSQPSIQSDRDHLDNLQNIPQVPQSCAKTSEESCKKRKAEEEIMVQSVKKPVEQNAAVTVSDANQLSTSPDAIIDELLEMCEGINDDCNDGDIADFIENFYKI